MSQSEIAISARNVSKSYTIAHNQEKHVTLAEAMLARLRHPFQRQDKETFWALRDISFDVKRGEVVGIIGRNGAGKSTLLKILSRITQPTTGRIELFGRVGSLLEVGTGFHAELTGRENIFLNGAILGMTKAEIRKQFDAIVDFAGVENFIDTPVKRYSSGMYVRLAFAVAAHLNPEILIIDEVLAVGDAEFQKRCLGKMQEVARGGRTVLFVSHQMQAVSTLCTQGIYMSNGRLDFMGDVSETISRYLNNHLATREERDEAAQRRRRGSGEIRFSEVRLDRMNHLTTDSITIDCEIDTVRQGQPSYFVTLEWTNNLGINVLQLDSRMHNMEFKSGGRRTLRFVVHNPRLAHGDYRIHAFICSLSGIIDWYEDAAQLSIAPLMPYPASNSNIGSKALVYPDFEVEDSTVAARVADATV